MNVLGLSIGDGVFRLFEDDGPQNGPQIDEGLWRLARGCGKPLVPR